jgi:DNA-binding SARP family transcriptional activator
VRLLGPLTISRDGEPLALPSSRKVRALLAYLALAQGAVGRTRLCELLWDVPNDPRGELRWCLSKIRRLVDEPARRRVETCGDTITLDLADCFVDAIEIASAAQAGIETLDPKRLRALSMLFSGDFLEGLEIDRSPYFNGWLIAQRRRFRACHAALLEQLVRSFAAEEEVFDYLEKWLELAPFDRRAHAILLDALARRGRIGEGEEHLAATARLFEAEGLDYAAARRRQLRADSRAHAPLRLDRPGNDRPDQWDGPLRHNLCQSQGRPADQLAGTTASMRAASEGPFPHGQRPMRRQ